MTVQATQMRPQRIYRYSNIKEVTGLSPDRIKHMVAEGIFPRPIKLCPGGKAVGWTEDMILQWQQELIEASLVSQESAA